jgi:hypothetical protein
VTAAPSVSVTPAPTLAGPAPTAVPDVENSNLPHLN